MTDIKEQLSLGQLTQEEAAMAMGVDRSLVSKYVNGVRKVPDDKLALLTTYVASKLSNAAAQINTIVNVADLEAERAAFLAQPDTRPIGRLWWSSHSRQGLDAQGEFIWAPVPSPYPGGPPLYESFPVSPPVTRPPLGMVHMFDHDLNQWLIEPEPA